MAEIGWRPIQLPGFTVSTEPAPAFEPAHTH